MTALHKGESPVGAGLTREQSNADDLHSAKVRGSAHALRVIEGERKAHEYLARLQASQADPDELALIVAMLYGAALRGFCRVLAKALGVNHA
ncbi:hypothetical protein [Rubrivivax albus]|uniref:Uncharacterized protein n=1 Tax=Rubrivivax albus TaxID=2499835 RepID=A0A437JYP6_9BURK|nr:hypothetical protein [Rubrivivax albus]RVT52750.1 hypothetical protein ENE75_10085 [Rubrivivax albus]